ncbi:MAG: hypothetical protein ACOY82_14145 [Pseudomonadota bacterium]
MNSNIERVLGRSLARELTREEVEMISGGGTQTACTCHISGGDDYCPDTIEK